MNELANPLVEIEGVSAGYEGKEVLHDVWLKVMPDDFVGIIGPNGGGKTTLLRLIIGQLSPTSGTVKRANAPFGYLPQTQQVDKRFPISVMDVVLSGLMGTLGLWARYRKPHRQKARELLQMAGIQKLEKKCVGELSGGQLQRVLLCRALISEPTMLILDEPTTYVDSNFEGELYELLRDLNKHMAILMVSHDLGTITSYVKTIACVNGTLHYHNSNRISNEQLQSYNCPIQIIAHGNIPHTVLLNHT